MLALAGGSWIFAGFLVVLFFAIVAGYYTRAGSGINQRPTDKRSGSPGAKGPSRISSAERPGKSAPPPPRA
jgi:hypothetical protein